jgi:hypothetical protein
MDQSPDPAHRRAHETLLKIPSHQLEEETTAFYQITEKKYSRNSHGGLQIEQYQFYQSLASGHLWLTEMH